MATRSNEMQKELHKHSKDRGDNNAEPEVFADSDALVDGGDFDETDVFESPTAASDNVGGASVELDVEQLLADFESEAASGVDAGGRVRKRLEAMMERKRRHEALIDFDEYDLDS
jgi:hypothetical protein